MPNLEDENRRLRLIVNTLVTNMGCFDPDSDEQVEAIALEWVTRYWWMKARLAELGVSNAGP